MQLKIMKGFEIRYNDKMTKVAVKNGMITVQIFNNNGKSRMLMDGDSRMYIGGVDYANCKWIIWHNDSPIKIGDKFEIKVAEIDSFSAPVEIKEDKSIKRPKTKLEFFRELEADLKKQGLI
jgi:hypothetical protein